MGLGCRIWTTLILHQKNPDLIDVLGFLKNYPHAKGEINYNKRYLSPAQTIAKRVNSWWYSLFTHCSLRWDSYRGMYLWWHNLIYIVSLYLAFKGTRCLKTVLQMGKIEKKSNFSFVIVSPLLIWFPWIGNNLLICKWIGGRWFDPKS